MLHIRLLAMTVTMALCASALVAETPKFATRAAGHVRMAPTALPDFIGDREHRPSWYLWLSPEDEAALTSQGEDWLVRLRVESQVKVLAAPLEDARKLAPELGWDRRPRWMLISDQGVELGQGGLLPTGDRILELYRAQGNPPAWEERAAFLRAHPELGSVWCKAVWKASWLARMRLKRMKAQGQVKTQAGAASSRPLMTAHYLFTATDPEAGALEADGVFQDLAAALEGLSKVPRWEENWFSSFMPPMVDLGAEASPAIRRVASGMLQELEATCRRDPGMALSMLWIEFATLAGAPPGLLPSNLATTPGRTWPPPDLIIGCVGRFVGKEDWEGALAFLSEQETLVPAHPASLEAMREGLAVRSAIWACRAKPLLKLGRIQEAAAALGESRRLSPDIWAAKEWATDLEPGEPGLPAAVKAALEQRPLPEPPLPPPPAPLRLALAGRPPWQEAWARLQRAEALLMYSPSELLWQDLTRDETAALAHARDWGAEPRWVLCRGPEVLAMGLDCPTPGALAATLASAGPPYLQQLNDFLEHHPDHAGARRARLELLKHRMPEPRLEPTLAEDARVVMASLYEMAFPPLPLDFGPKAPWKPDPSLWQWSALQVLPRLEQLLRSWPNNASYWQAWTAWSRFHPLRPSPRDLARTLELRGTQESWMRDLNPAVHGAVSDALKRDPDYRAMADWLLDAWDVQDHTPANEVPADQWEQPWRAEHLEALKQGIIIPLTEALVALGLPREADAIKLEFRRMTRRDLK